MPVKALTEFLDDHHVKYVTIKHSLAYTAQQIAHSAHIPGKELAKTVMVKLDGRMVMAIVRGPDRVDLERLRAVSRAEKVELADEDEFRGMFPGVDPGAMPPFGNLYGMPVYVDERLAADEVIAFNAGTHSELIELAYADFERLVEPRVARFAKP
ncbi:MAG: YbaK/EbsC family protein [Gammaproteobacteria bacterium]|nr:YbaK/EbsC family protein [Gammaproteobacteria bacterium]